MGGFVGQLMPYYASLSSVSGGLSMLGSLLPMSIASILKPSNANAADMSLYENACPSQNTLKASDGSGNTLAANIFCQPIAATVVSDNWNPNDTMASMQSMQTDGASEIDPNTGQATVPTDPVSQTVKDTVSSVTSLLPGSTLGYADWLDTCSNPANATDCAGDDQTSQTYSLYTAANTTSIMLDGDISSAQTASGVSSSSASTGTDTSSQSLAFNVNTLNDSSSFSNISTAQTFGSVLNLITPIHELLRTYGATVFASAAHQASPVTSLEGFTLWG